MNRIRTGKILLFIGIAYALCWAVVLAFFSYGGTLKSGWFGLVATGVMFTPAISALIIHKGIENRPLNEIGVFLRFNRWWIYAIIIPIAVTLLSIPASTLIPGITMTDGLPFINEQLSQAGLTEAQLETVRAEIDAWGRWFPAILVGAILVVGPIAGLINAIPAFGEELGWRGFLQKELKPLGFWPSSLLVGVIWGLWHLPLILQGYNYPEHPVRGAFMMTLFTVLLSPVMAHMREQSETVFTAAVFHGAINAVGAFSIIFLAGGSDLTEGLTGLGGMIVLIALNILLYRHRRRNKG